MPWSPSDAARHTSHADTPETRAARTHYIAAVSRADSDLGEIRAALAQPAGPPPESAK